MTDADPNFDPSVDPQPEVIPPESDPKLPDGDVHIVIPDAWDRATVPVTGSLERSDDPVTPVVPDGTSAWRFVAMDGDQMVIDYRLGGVALTK